MPLLCGIPLLLLTSAALKLARTQPKFVALCHNHVFHRVQYSRVLEYLNFHAFRGFQPAARGMNVNRNNEN
jgi:hypothetical protein